MYPSDGEEFLQAAFGERESQFAPERSPLIFLHCCPFKRFASLAALK